ncbi:MAG: hypothetical protein EBY40_12575 [Marivivens sp.]|nr:hypothetical protein [Marivivens sp.]
MRSLTLFLVLSAPMAQAAVIPAPLTDDDFLPVRQDEAELGQLLFYDPILSGNKEVACATCHHPSEGTGDGLSLSIGDGGRGLGPNRVVDMANLPEQRIPRNAQPLFNLGAKEFRALFHDGRVELDPNRPSGLRTPLEDEMVAGFASIVSAQTMFPVLSADEMAGCEPNADPNPLRVRDRQSARHRFWNTQTTRFGGGIGQAIEEGDNRCDLVLGQFNGFNADCCGDRCDLCWIIHDAPIRELSLG